MRNEHHPPICFVFACLYEFVSVSKPSAVAAFGFIYSALCKRHLTTTLCALTQMCQMRDEHDARLARVIIYAVLSLVVLAVFVAATVDCLGDSDACESYGHLWRVFLFLIVVNAFVSVGCSLSVVCSDSRCCVVVDPFFPSYTEVINGASLPV
jgi:hypothetical protein